MNDDKNYYDSGSSENQNPHEDRDPKYDTEKFIADESYMKEKINSYSHYNNYSEEDSIFDEPINPEPKYEEKRQYGMYTDNLDSDDVRRVVNEELSRRRKPLRGILSALMFGLIGSLLGIALYTQVLPRFVKTEEIQPIQNKPAIQINASEQVNIESAVNEKAGKSVVGISTQIRTGNDFFTTGIGEGVGSGVIVSEDGYILTNSHVVNDGQTEQIQVVFHDKESVPAKLVWNDPSLDLAVIKVEKSGLTPIELGDSDQIKVGDKAIAIGNPLGLDLQSTLTSGYVSGLARSITMQNGVTMDGLIQTDAAINRGNSGGALLNSSGQLIGINTAKASGGEGIGFAIPVNTAAAIVDKIKTTQSFEPVVMGIKAVNVDYYKNMTGNELDVEDGIIVMEVVPGSPADTAGIRSNDIIRSINSQEVQSMSQLKTLLLGFSLGDQVTVGILRDGQPQELNLTFSGELS